MALDIRLGSVAPKGSPWVKILNQVAMEWKTITGNKVRLRLYPGGIVGDEDEMLRKMRLRQLDAAALTISGMNQVAKGVLAISTPMMLENYDELRYVLDQVGPYFEARFEEERFIILSWIFIGWTYFFSKKSLTTPQDLVNRKLWVIKTNQNELQTWKNAGTNPVSLSVQDVLLSLQSGKIDTFYSTKTSAAAFQWFGISKHMLDMPWAPMIAGLMVSKRTWDKVPLEFRSPLKASAQKAGDQLSQESLKLDEKALTTMKEYGLKVHKAKPEDRKKWKVHMEKYFDLIIEKEMGRDSYVFVKRAADSYKKKSVK